MNAARCVARAKDLSSVAGIARALREAGRDAHACWSEARWVMDDVRRQHRLSARAPLPPRATQQVADMLARLARDEPIAYVLGTQPFGPIDVQVRAPVLIPRPETESWALRVAAQLEASMRRVPRPMHIVDLCAGTGCIGLVLAHALRHVRDVRVTLADNDPEALALCVANRGRVPCGATRVAVRALDLWDAAAAAQLGPYDLLVCNPPYIAADEHATLDVSVRAYESRRALVGDTPNTDGLDYYRRLAELLPQGYMRATRDRALPSAVLEVGAGQAPAVESLVREAGHGLFTTETV
ncbi:hypothetical protein MCAP1_000882 [Malassezia caprae]|uniref:peptide chain release factor N(5)-glutamine methyltransferase n=1 Tax=Malassezia caprae TaxID=1381934 RepID=A0AAF0E4X1_9BASI|nr:hypothetical protein MCAP1_000882 [Malassezia caprae]